MSGILSFVRLPARDPQESHRASTQLELFFDLISVVAVAAITAGLHHAISEGHGLEKLPIFAFLFFAIWWAWMNFTWFASAFDNDGPIYRILVMIIMTGEVLFAGGAGHIFETFELGWGVAGWTVMRLAMAALWLRASLNTKHRVACLRYAAGILVAQGYWIGFYFVVPAEQFAFFALGILGFVFELSVPVIAERAKPTPFHRHHIIERYGLLMIIMLGEIILAISLGFGALYGDHADVSVVPGALSGLVIAFGLFWLYFCAEEHLPSHELKAVFIWGYSHVFAFGSVAAIGAAVAAELDLVTEQAHTSQNALSWWFGAPLAVFFMTLWIARDRYVRLGRRALALPVAAVVALLAAIAGLPGWAYAAISIAAIIWRVPLRPLSNGG